MYQQISNSEISSAEWHFCEASKTAIGMELCTATRQNKVKRNNIIRNSKRNSKENELSLLF